jgi:hypothetical protein
MTISSPGYNPELETEGTGEKITGKEDDEKTIMISEAPCPRGRSLG